MIEELNILFDFILLNLDFNGYMWPAVPYRQHNYKALECPVAMISLYFPPASDGTFIDLCT